MCEFRTNATASVDVKFEDPQMWIIRQSLEYIIFIQMTKAYN